MLGVLRMFNLHTVVVTEREWLLAVTMWTGQHTVLDMILWGKKTNSVSHSWNCLAIVALAVMPSWQIILPSYCAIWPHIAVLSILKGTHTYLSLTSTCPYKHWLSCCSLVTNIRQDLLLPLFLLLSMSMIRVIKDNKICQWIFHGFVSTETNYLIRGSGSLGRPAVLSFLVVWATLWIRNSHTHSHTHTYKLLENYGPPQFCIVP